MATKEPKAIKELKMRMSIDKKAKKIVYNNKLRKKAKELLK